MVMEVICVIDAAATILYASPSAERVFGYPSDRLIGTNIIKHVRPGRLAGPFKNPIRSILHIRRPSVRCHSPNPLAQSRWEEWRSVESTAANCLHDGGVYRANRGQISGPFTPSANTRRAVADLPARTHVATACRARRITAREVRSVARILTTRKSHDEFGPRSTLFA